jgi:hypothetical protein
MASVWNPDAAQVTLEGRLLGQQYINRFYVRKQGPPSAWTGAQLLEACQKAEAFLSLNLAPLLSNQLTFTEVRARVMVPDVAAQVILPVAVTGGRVAEALPNNVAACMTLSSGFAGRGGRGRMYVGGITGGDVTQSTFNAAFIEDLNDAFQTGLLVRFSETGPDTPMDIVIYSQFLNDAPRSEALLTVVQSIAMRDNIVDSQRRRLPGRGA